MDLRVRHLTRYDYGVDVSFGPHRLMLRPRDSFDLRILRTSLALTPPANLAWHHDMYGNSIAIASFLAPGASLVIDSILVLRRYGSTVPRHAVGDWISGAPIAYHDQERIVLEPYMRPADPDDTGQVRAFAEQAVLVNASQSPHPLLALCDAVHRAHGYTVRFEEGTQRAAETLQKASGSCRDLAWLFIEAARHLGYAARFVTGYLHNVTEGSQSQTAALQAVIGLSHAWAEVFIPGDGWIEFDPTNALVADRQLIRVAVTRTPAEAVPVSGSFIGAVGRPIPDVSVVIEPCVDASLDPPAV